MEKVEGGCGLSYLCVKNWCQHFENHDSKKIKKGLTWLPLPVKHDGSGYRRLIGATDGPLHYAAWVLILQVAAKCEPRGVLVGNDGSPLTTEDLAFKTGAPEILFVDAIPRLVQVGWLEECQEVSISRHLPASPGVPGDSAPTLHNSTGHNKINIFRAPSVEEVQAYVREKGYHFDPKRFVAHYQSKGWLVGKAPMKDWHAACVTWEQTWKEQNGKLDSGPDRLSAAERLKRAVATVEAEERAAATPRAKRAAVSGASVEEPSADTGVGG